ncbi:MAG: hypothetical protein GXO61_03465 [Epsilonproteobacteria bacterium]|nr:hypothetical protein [Campylobacterota bacterium]
MRELDLEDFSTFNRLKRESKQLAGEDPQKRIEELERFYQEKIAALERDYKELLSKVTKESYEQGFNDAKEKLQEEFEQKLVQLQQELEKQKQEEVKELQERYLNFEKKFQEQYKNYLHRFSDIVTDSMGEILEFLYIDKRNSKYVENIINRLIEDFNNHLPLSIKVSKEMYPAIKERFQNVNVEVNPELENNEFIIEFQEFKVENRIKDKLTAIKDEIKRETKKLT